MGQSLAHGVKGREILRAADADAVFTALSSDARYQGLDSDLTAIAGLTTTNFGRQLLTRTDAADVRSYIGAGTSNSSFDGTFAGLSAKPTTISGYGISDALTSSQIASAYQPLDSDLTAIAALTTTSYGRAFLELADQAAFIVLLGSSETDHAFSETITWTGTTAPSGTPTTRYQWYRVGKFVSFQFRFEWSVAGSTLTAAAWPFPSGFPTPATLTGQGSSEVMQICTGSASTSSSSGTNHSPIEARIHLNSSSALEAKVRFSSANVASLWYSGWYQCQ